MPAEKQRLRLLLSRLVLGGANDDAVTGLLAGSAAFVVPAFDGTTAGSTERVVATITGMTACHRMVATPQSIGPCVVLVSVCPGTDNASAVFGLSSGCVVGAVAGSTITLAYVAFKRP